MCATKFDMRECPRCKHRLHWHRVYSDGEWAVCVGAPGCGCTYALSPRSEGGGERRRVTAAVLVDCDRDIVAPEWVFTGYWNVVGVRYERERRSSERRARASESAPA